MSLGILLEPCDCCCCVDRVVCCLQPCKCMGGDGVPCCLQVMGSAHNMFGTLNVVTVRSSGCSDDSVSGEQAPPTPACDTLPLVTWMLMFMPWHRDGSPEGAVPCEVAYVQNGAWQELVRDPRPITCSVECRWISRDSKDSPPDRARLCGRHCGAW